MTELLHQPGFFGTTANSAADLTLAVRLLAAVLFTTGSILARRGNSEALRWV